MEEYDEVALLRYRIMAPLLDPDLKRGSRAQILEQLSQSWHKHPNSKKEVQFQLETIRHWLKRYKKDGFSGLKSKIRKDKSRTPNSPINILPPNWLPLSMIIVG